MQHAVPAVLWCSYYIAVPLSLLPSSWYYQQQWQRLAPVEDLPGMLQQQLSALSIPSTVSLGQALVSGACPGCLCHCVMSS